MITSALVCLALNIYHEARGEPLAGQIAVTQVVFNRVESPHFPDTICDVVKQGHYNQQGNVIRNKCQFSWWCDGKSDVPKDTIRWEEALNLADTMLSSNHYDIVEGALYYHATHVKPYWADHFKKTVTIQNHIFYR